MGYVTREMIDRAKEMDLLTYLQTYEPQELVHFGGSTYCTREHDSLKISNGKWCWFSRGIGGRTALDYLIKVKEIPFTDAVERIVGRAAEQPPISYPRQQPERTKTLLLPQASRCATHAVEYLHSRGIDYELIDFCIRTGRLYESYPHHNVVFVGKDKAGQPRYACLRGIGTDFKGEATGSDKRFSFSIPAEESSQVLYLFESAIDLLSFATLAQEDRLPWRSQHLLSLAGVYQPKKNLTERHLPLALSQYLRDHREIQTIYLCLDNDLAGRSAADAIRQQLAGRYVVLDGFPCQGKDYNDWLCLRKGLPITRTVSKPERSKANHLHNHFVLNTVSFVDGIKYHRTEKDYHDMRTVSDTLCREYNLSVIQRPQAGKSKHYGEWRAEQEQRPTWRGLIRSEIDELIRQSVTEKQFYYLLRQKGYEVKFGKDISVRPPGKERFVRLTRNFGEAYTAEAIRQRILQQPLPQPERQMTDKPRPKTYRVQGSRQAARKITGFRALYFYYCYKLGIFPKGRPQNRARLHFLLREDLLKLNNISQEVRLLARHQIDTAEQLALYKKEQEVNIRELSAKRRVLQNALRTKAVRDSPKQADAHRAQIRELSERLKALRREVHLCDDIAERSGVMVEKLKAVREDAQKQRQKEEQQNEHIRRRS